MKGNLLARYTWLIDTLRRNGRMTRDEINRRWLQSDVSGGQPLARRTFYNYRQSISELFGTDIEFDTATNEYYIAREESGRNHSDTVTDWMLNSAAMGGLLADAREVSARIFVEKVPSARQNLAPIINAIKQNRAIRFTYSPYWRSMASTGVTIEPYLLKLFRQRWYVAGHNVAENRIKTYALDRMSELEQTSRSFMMPADFDPAEYFRYSFGIVVDKSEPRNIMIKADSRQAKYMRALPLHESQEEMVHDTFSIFTYRLRPTEDFLQELMAQGPNIEVVAPVELRTMLAERLRATLDKYK